MNYFEDKTQSIMDEMLLNMRDYFKCDDNDIMMHDLEIMASGNLSFMFETHLIIEGSGSNESIYQENIFLEIKRSREEVVYYNGQPFKYPEEITELFRAIQLYLDNKKEHLYPT